MTGKVLALLLFVAFVADSYAHHSRSAFDLGGSIAVEGNVTEVGWTNPHFYLTVADPDTGLDWTFEGHSIPGLVRNGWSRTTLTVGSRVRVVANPNNDPDIRFGLLDHVTRTDGKTFYSFRPTEEIRARQRPPLAPSTDFTGTWIVIRTLRQNLVGGFGTTDDWPLTELGEDAVANFDIKNDPVLRCAPRGLPRMLEYPYAQQWQAVGDAIEITIEHSTATRRLNPALANAVSTQPEMGRSIITTRDSDRLVVESGGFEPLEWGLWRGIDSSDGKRITEEYRLTEDGYRMALTYTIEDPRYLTAPVERTLEFRKLHDFSFAEEPPCDVATATRHLQFEE